MVKDGNLTPNDGARVYIASVKNGLRATLIGVILSTIKNVGHTGHLGPYFHCLPLIVDKLSSPRPRGLIKGQ